MRLPWILIVINYLVLIATDIVILYDLETLSLYSKYKPSFKKAKKWDWQKTYLVFAILILLLFTVAICLPRRSEGSDITGIIWMLFIVLSVIISQIIYCVFSFIGYIPKIFRKRRWNTGLWIGLPMSALVFCMMWWGALIGRNRIDIVNVEISSTSLPESFNGYRIVQLSDLHVGTWGQDTAFISRLVDSVNNQHPDLIVFTGDIVNRKTSELKPFVKTLARLKARDGVISILGNHDYGDYINWNNENEKTENLSELKRYEKAMGWTLLDNKYLDIINGHNDTITIIGVGNWGEPPFSRYGDLREAYKERDINDKRFKILLSHNPEHWKQEVSHISNIDLTLSGHTHAMQIMFSLGDWRWSPSKYKYDQWGGLYTRKLADGSENRVYVNIGAGEVGLPMRIGASPEITVFTLRK